MGTRDGAVCPMRCRTKSRCVWLTSSLHAVEFSLYEGFEQKGRSEMVFLRGNLVVEDGKYTGQLGQGNFLKAEPYGAAYDSLR